MLRRRILPLLALVVGLGVFAADAQPARAQQYNLNPFWYYPYYYFPHNFWPVMGPKYPEPPGTPYVRPPAYMSFPPYKEKHWRYEYWEPQPYYRGNHFLLDIF
ncbi:MAG: hypothetical protein JNM56_11735 [Planctomycetia bacterium]|nr:hypothetical protein [Planctomycetia bacterium]